MIVQTILRVCPECGALLDGMEGDAVYGCSACGLAVVAADGRRLALRFARAPRQDRPSVVLPVFEFPMVLRTEPGAEAPMAEKLQLVERGFVGGFRVRRFQDYGDLGVEYTRRQTRFEAGRIGRVDHKPSY